ncbi:hypothetical protein MG296_10635 [Flavobacteriaceae bacterium TK19130]|nr:hypothetical protein [Thermobacterium salinum]
MFTNSEVLSIVSETALSNLDLDGLEIPLLPEKYSVNSNTDIRNQNQRFRHKIDFPVVPQDDNLRDLLSEFNNTTVIAFLIRKTFTQLYGTTEQPLVFTFDELHDSNPTGLKGFSISLQGDSYAPAKYYTAVQFSAAPTPPFLAFQLAGNL